MVLKRIEVSNFRNYEKLLLEFHEGVNVFIGQNGAGKSNILEAVYLSCQGRSFRTSQSEQLIQKSGPGQAQVLSHFFDQGVSHRFDSSLRGSQKKIYWNGQGISANSLGQKFPTLVFQPETLSVIKEGPSERRNFVDESLEMQSKEKRILIRNFRQILRIRNRVLSDRRDGKNVDQTPAEEQNLLDSINDQFLEAAAKLTYARIELLRSHKNLLKEYSQGLLQKQKVDISVDYLISGDNSLGWSFQEVYNSLHNRAYELKQAEVESGSSLVGPHKHDIRITFDGEDSRFYCSQGQQRCLILAFQMSLIDSFVKSQGKAPLLILDDVLSELDSLRRDQLVSYLKGLKTQIFISSTELSVTDGFERKKLELFLVEDGRVLKQSQDLFPKSYGMTEGDSCV